MAEDMDVAGDAPGGDTRRDALKKLGVGAAVAWSVPVIASSPAWAGASDAPFPPRDCPACGSNVVPNGQATVDGAPSTTGWTVSGGSLDSIPYFFPSDPANDPDVFVIDPASTTIGGTPVVMEALFNLPPGPNGPGGCAERPARFSFLGRSVDANSTLSATIEYAVNGGAFSLAGQTTVPGVTVANLLTNGLAARCINTTLPTAALSDTINVRIRFSCTAGPVHLGYVDAVSLVLCAAC